MPDVEAFTVSVPEEVLKDLAVRLDRGRPPALPIRGGGETIETIDRIDALVRYWRDGYDWRSAEHRLNQVPHFRSTVDGVGIHFIHVPGTGPDPLPLLLTNGWPSSFVEYLGVLGPLTNPGAYGGDPKDSFSVVIATLPGFGFSDQCLDRPVSEAAICELFHRLMTENLGYDRYVAHGDDIGGGVVNELGIHHAGPVAAIQTLSWHEPFLDGAAPLTVEERAYQEARAQRSRTEGAYSRLHTTRPHTLAYGLNDSPLGLAAWILEKFLTWTDPAVRARLSADDLLTTVTLYWATQTIGSSIRLYTQPYGPFSADDVVSAPAAVLVPNQPTLPSPPQSWLELAYRNLIRFVPLTEGGHFFAMEAPEHFVAETRTTFRPYRSAQ